MVLPRSSRAMLSCLLTCLIIDALCLAFSSFVCPQSISNFLAFLPSLVGISVLSIPAPFSGAAVRAPISSIPLSHIPCTFSFPPRSVPLFKFCSALQAQAQITSEPQWRGSAARRRGTKELAFSNRESFLLSLMRITPQTLHCIRVLGSLYVRPL
jgi:hypothetical protein